MAPLLARRRHGEGRRPTEGSSRPPTEGRLGAGGNREDARAGGGSGVENFGQPNGICSHACPGSEIFF
jgi:hypothetical protein